METVLDVARLVVERTLPAVDLRVAAGEIVALICPEPRGADTLLRLLATTANTSNGRPVVVDATVGPSSLDAAENTRAEIVLVTPCIDRLDHDARRLLERRMRERPAEQALVFAASSACIDFPFDRAIAVLWTAKQLLGELAVLRPRVHVRVTEILELVETRDPSRAAIVATEVRRLRTLSGALRAALFDQASGAEDRAAAKRLVDELEAASLSDRLLERIAGTKP